MANVIYVTKAGLDFLHARLAQANAELVSIRKEKSVAYTATGDTWHDNPYFNRLEQDERHKSEEVRELSGLIKSAQLYAFDVRNTKRVQIGSIIHLSRYYKISGAEDEIVLEVVGFGETDIGQKKVGYNAPMMRDLMGLRVGESVETEGARGSVEIEILKLFSGWNEVPEQLR